MERAPTWITWKTHARVAPRKNRLWAIFSWSNTHAKILGMRTIFLLLFLATVTLAFVHFAALEFFLYWQYVWLDVPVHFLGGTIVALLFLALLDLGLPCPSWCQKLIPVLVLVLIVGVLWEVYELLIGIIIRDNYVFDTTLDLIMDVCGGYVGYVVGNKVRVWQK